MQNTRIINWPEGTPQPGQTHTEHGRTWIYIALPAGSTVPGVWKSLAPEGGSGGGGGGAPSYHTHGFEDIFDADGNDLNDVVAGLEGDIAALQGDLIFAGSYNPSTSQMVVASNQGFANGFADGAPLPTPSDQNKKFYVMCVEAGNFDGSAMSRGDWLISDGVSWIPLNYVSLDGVEVPVLGGTVPGSVLTWDGDADLWTENTNFVMNKDGDVTMSGDLNSQGKAVFTGSVTALSFIGDGSQLTGISSGEGGGAVDSVNGQTGVVVLTASDVGAQPAGDYLTTETDPTVPTHVKGITTEDIAKWNAASGAEPAVVSVNGKDGVVVLTAADVGALPDDYTPPAAPVLTVNQKTGNVVLTASDVGAQPAGSYLTSSDLSGYATESWVSSNYQPAGSYAASNHSHSDYAAKSHSHSEYAASSHSHNYAPNSAGNGISISSGKIQMSGSYTGSFTASGDVTAYSDEALKMNITTAPCDVIEQLRGVEFEWKEDGRFGSGVIAQEVEQVLPHLVHMHEDGHKSVNYNGLMGYLIEEVKALKAEVEALRGV